MTSTVIRKGAVMPFFLRNDNGEIGLNWTRLLELAVIVLATLWGNYQLMQTRIDQMQATQQQILRSIEQIQRDFYKPVYEHDRK